MKPRLILLLLAALFAAIVCFAGGCESVATSYDLETRRLEYRRQTLLTDKRIEGAKITTPDGHQLELGAAGSETRAEVVGALLELLAR